MLRWLAFVIGVLAFANGCAAARLEAASISVDNLLRTYLIDVPAGTHAAPTIIMLHGLGGSAQGAAAATHLAPLGERQGFVTVFPNAIGHQWDHFLPGTVPPGEAQRYQSVGGPPDDVAFLKDLIADLVTRGVSDPTRVYLGGFSNGGFMVMRMVCDDAGAFAAVALISSSMPSQLGQDCQPAVPIPIMMEKGTADRNVPYEGGYVLDHTFTVWSAAQLTAMFTRLDGCTGAPTQSEEPGVNNATIEIQNWSGCASGPVTLYTVEGGVHTVYQIPPPAPTVWGFFKSHTR